MFIFHFTVQTIASENDKSFKNVFINNKLFIYSADLHTLETRSFASFLSHSLCLTLCRSISETPLVWSSGMSSARKHMFVYYSTERDSKFTHTVFFLFTVRLCRQCWLFHMDRDVYTLYMNGKYVAIGHLSVCWKILKNKKKITINIDKFNMAYTWQKTSQLWWVELPFVWKDSAKLENFHHPQISKEFKSLELRIINK